MKHCEQYYSVSQLEIITDFCLGGEATQKIDVTGLLTGLVATGVLLVITGLLIYYFCKNRCKARQPPG